MAENDEDKQHHPTGKRLADLRRGGNVMRSRDLTGGMLFIVAVLTVTLMSSTFKETFINNFYIAFNSIHLVMNQQTLLPEIVHKIVLKSFIKLLLPIFIFGYIVTLLSPFLFGGWNFTLEVLQFKLMKMNPLNNISSLFTFKAASIEMLRSSLKSIMILGVTIIFMANKRNLILTLTSFAPKAAISACYEIITQFVFDITLVVIALAVIDVFYHYYKYMKDAKMTTQEVRDEAKDAEGNTEVKQKMRVKQFMLLKQRLGVSVPKATVIITNPTHYAVALKYDDRKDRAPKVVAKGADLLAQEIRYLAITNAIPIYEAPVLARALYRTTKIGFEINPGLYKAVAIVLTYVYQMRNYQQGRGELPRYIRDMEIPEEFIFHEQ